MNKRGTKAIIDDIETKNILKKLIVEFDEKYNVKPKVAYIDIYEFVKSENEQKRIKFYPSYTWWKTKGKHLVDDYNIVKKKTIRLSEKEDLDVVDIIDLIEKHFKDKDMLIKHLLPYNVLVERLSNKINNLQSNLTGIMETVTQKDKLINETTNKLKKMENFNDELFYSLIGSEKELKRIFHAGETNSEVTNFALTETFGSPIKYIEEFSKRLFEYQTTSQEPQNNIIHFQTKHKLNSQETDYDW